MPAAPIRLFLCGDVMTGRGLDQVLPHPVDPVLYEDAVRDARDYVRLAERANGPIPRPVDGSYLWGEALAVMAEADLRIINLETSITARGEAWPAKGIHYRMHPRNIGCLTAARIDGCALANNHVLDWGYAGLADTLGALDAAGIAHAGAGADRASAEAPAVIEVPGKGRVLLFSLGSATSGIPPAWRASRRTPGVNLLEDLSGETARRLAGGMRRHKRPGDVVLASIHWGDNWGYQIPEAQIGFARALIEAGVDLVHGHSSHHPKACEVYRGHLILYGCGDFLDDYEGIGGYEAFRPDLRLSYTVLVDPADGRLVEARLVPMRAARFRLSRATAADLDGLSAIVGGRSMPDGSVIVT